MDILVLDENFFKFVMCRVCMVNITSIACKSIFSFNIAEMFTKCTDIKVNISDGLPAHLCLTCFQTLQLVHSFKEQCIASDLKLKELFKRNHPSPKDPLFDTEHVYVPEIKLEEEYYLRDENESTSKVLELPKHELVDAVVCKAEPLDEDVEKLQMCNLQTNADTDVMEDDKKQLKTSTKIQDENNSSEKSEVLPAEEKVQKKKKKAKPHVCHLCGYKFITTFHLKRHIAMHSQLDKFKCDVCNKVFSRAMYLTRHKKYHNEVRQFVCDLCGKTFVRKDRLNAHIKHTHTDPLLCKDCSKTFQTIYSLRYHIERVHMAQKKHVCDSCGKMFFSRSELYTHKRTHTKERPHECTYCKKHFGTKSHLTSHTRMHTGSRPYACDLCPKTFGHSRVLKDHRRTHTGEKPHVCDVCQRAFTQRVALRTHMKVHTGKPPSDKTANNTTTS